MRIINESNEEIHYLVTQSGTILPDSKIIASGLVPRNGTQKVNFIVDPGLGPIVYLGGGTVDKNFIGVRAKNRDSDVQLNISVSNPGTDDKSSDY